MSQYGYYSSQQFKNICDNEKKYPYIYYKDINDYIVQVTEVTSNSNYKSMFNDAIYLGELKQFYSVSENPIDLQSEKLNKKS